MSFDGEAMSIILDMLENGQEKAEAIKEYIKEADEAKEAYYQLIWRYDYAYQAYFYGDPVSAMPVASEFTEIYEADPHALDSVPENGGAEAYLMITQMGLDNVVALPQVPMKEWEDMMDRFHALVKRFNLGHKVYWWQLARFWQYIDKEKAFQYFITYWEREFDFKPNRSQVLFHMATGSGKTLIMAGLMLYLFDKGYKNFLFLVDKDNVIEKTNNNFFNKQSSKYQFAHRIVIGSKPVEIKKVQNFQETDENAINICLATLQGFHNKLNYHFFCQIHNHLYP